MKTKKLWTALLVTSMTVSLAAAGCGKKEDKDNTVSEDGVKTLTFYNADLQEDDPWTDPVAKALTEKTGVQLKTDHPVGEDKQRISLMIAEQNFPDMIYTRRRVYGIWKKCNGNLLWRRL